MRTGDIGPTSRFLAIVARGPPSSCFWRCSKLHVPRACIAKYVHGGHGATKATSGGRGACGKNNSTEGERPPCMYFLCMHGGQAAQHTAIQLGSNHWAPVHTFLGEEYGDGGPPPHVHLLRQKMQCGGRALVAPVVRAHTPTNVRKGTCVRSSLPRGRLSLHDYGGLV
eukprot:gene18622-biopygen12971